MAQIVLDTLLGHFKNGEILQTGSQHGNEWARIRKLAIDRRVPVSELAGDALRALLKGGKP